MVNITGLINIEMNEHLLFQEIQEQLLVVNLKILLLILKNGTIELMGSRMLNRTFKDGVFTADISGVKHEYYKKIAMRIKKP